MSLRSLEHAVAETFVGIRRNGLMALASVATTALSFTILGTVVLLALGLNNVSEKVLKQFEIGVFLKEGTTKEEISELSRAIRAMPHVEKVQFIPKEEAWEQVKAEYRGQVELSGVEENPLPDKFCVKLDHPRYTARTAAALRKLDHVDEVIEAQGIVEKVVGFADLIRYAGIVAACGLFLIAAFMVSNTIRLTVYARRREIRIMQLIGASNWFIRLPLVLEGIVLGAIGGAIACVLIFGGSRYISEIATQTLPLLKQYSSGVDPRYFYGGLVGAGCLVGAVGSMISIRRFLKV